MKKENKFFINKTPIIQTLVHHSIEEKIIFFLSIAAVYKTCRFWYYTKRVLHAFVCPQILKFVHL